MQEESLLTNKKTLFKDSNQRIELSHGGGGKAMAKLIEQLFFAHFSNQWLAQQNDAALATIPSNQLAITTDAYVISPLFFPGGNIGCLSVHGTLNDLAMMGAQPLYLTASFILEEGLLLSTLERIVASMAQAAHQADVAIIAGDTKVVEKGKGDGIYITTTGFGHVSEKINISSHRAKPGDKVIINGFMGDHGIAVMSKRENLDFVTHVQSDTASLHQLVDDMVTTVPQIHCLRDPTRGGLATALNELAQQSGVGFLIDEHKIPIREEVASACAFLGLDPLYVANEGKLIAVCPAAQAETLLQTMQAHPLGRDAAIIGEVLEDARQFVQLKMQFGGMRILDWKSGEQLPRIC